MCARAALQMRHRECSIFIYCFSRRNEYSYFGCIKLFGNRTSPISVDFFNISNLSCQNGEVMQEDLNNENYELNIEPSTLEQFTLFIKVYARSTINNCFELLTKQRSHTRLYWKLYAHERVSITPTVATKRLTASWHTAHAFNIQSNASLHRIIEWDHVAGKFHHTQAGMHTTALRFDFRQSKSVCSKGNMVFQNQLFPNERIFDSFVLLRVEVERAIRCHGMIIIA